MESIIAWIQQLEFRGLLDELILVAAAILSITVHETSHGLVAYWLGDPTAKRAGRLTLNPLKHIDLSGLLMMAVVKFGWAKPVPIDIRYFQHPKGGMALTALAGPVSNILLAFLGILMRHMLYFALWSHGESVFLGGLINNLITFCLYVAIISGGLAVFNLIPIPPLDGSKVLFSLLPQRYYLKLMQYERYGMLILIVLLLSGVLDTPLIYLRSGLLTTLDHVGTDLLYGLLHFFF